MGKTRAAYPPEFRRQMVDLVRAGRSPEELAREFAPLPSRFSFAFADFLISRQLNTTGFRPTGNE